jgi:ribosomal protein S18 acetylase RimI-like enzyme
VVIVADDVLEWGSERVRARPWRGNNQMIELTLMPEVGAPSSRFVRRCLALLADRGVTEVVTGALTPSEQVSFLDAGFEIREELRLLTRHLRDLPAPKDSEKRLRRAHPHDHPGVLEVDHLAFRPFWRLDELSLEDAVAATPKARFRVIDDGPKGAKAVIGYAISGRAGRRGYLQRLAVHPERRRAGLGQALVLDALRWMRRRAVERALVNTQPDNQPALCLYEHLGFVYEPYGLAVLTRRLD